MGEAMYAFIVIVIFLLILAFIVYREYRNEKMYQEERKERHKTEKDIKRTLNKDIKRVSHYTAKKTLQKTSTDTTEEASQRSVYQQKLDSAIQTVEKATREKKTKKTEEEKETVQKNNLDMPKYNYVQFDHSRLIKMGFSDKESKEFVMELIPQIASQMPALQEAIEKNDTALIDNITHDLKGAAGNIGSGGIADLMNDFNSYVKRGDAQEVLQAYYKHVEHYYKELKQQYQV